jgi:hypothetical protein
VTGRVSYRLVPAATKRHTHVFVHLLATGQARLANISLRRSSTGCGGKMAINDEHVVAAVAAIAIILRLFQKAIYSFT